ncbi:MAG: hypothetical protein H6619_01650 [Deltaproteobacteria bacterium]|nr:hypothetical protein [Deltaproteobacteria bacterium]
MICRDLFYKTTLVLCVVFLSSNIYAEEAKSCGTTTDDCIKNCDDALAACIDGKEIDDEISQKKAEIEKLKQQIEDANLLVNELDQSCDLSIADCDDYKDQIAEKESKIGELEDEIEGLEDKKANEDLGPECKAKHEACLLAAGISKKAIVIEVSDTCESEYYTARVFVSGHAGAVSTDESKAENDAIKQCQEQVETFSAVVDPTTATAAFFCQTYGPGCMLDHIAYNSDACSVKAGSTTTPSAKNWRTPVKYSKVASGYQSIAVYCKLLDESAPAITIDIEGLTDVDFGTTDSRDEPVMPDEDTEVARHDQVIPDGGINER